VLVYYGKLPAFGDFVRFNASGPEIKALDQWIQEAMYFSKRRLKPHADIAFSLAPVFYFFLTFEGCPNYITGLMKPSEDKVGRKYPFVVAILCNKSVIGDLSRPFLPVIFQSFYETAHKFIGKLTVETSSDELFEKAKELQAFVNSAETGNLALFDEYLKMTSISDFLSSILREEARIKETLLFRNLSDMTKYINQRNIQNLDFGFRFPIGSASGSVLYPVSFWIRLFYSLLNGNRTQPYLIWGVSDSHEASNLFLFFTPPMPHIFTYMLHTHLTSDSIYRMDADGSGASVLTDGKIPAPFRSVLETGDSTLDSLLNIKLAL
jgi:type VI secretion system protein ImpM